MCHSQTHSAWLLPTFLICYSCPYKSSVVFFCQTAPTHTPTQDCTLFTPIFNLASFKKNMFVLSTHENINLWGYLIVVSFLH